MASIRKRGQHQWEAQVRRQGYPAQSKTFNTKAEAEAWAKMIESEMSRGVWLSRSEAEATTLYEALTRVRDRRICGEEGIRSREVGLEGLHGCRLGQAAPRVYPQR